MMRGDPAGGSRRDRFGTCNRWAPPLRRRVACREQQVQLLRAGLDLDLCVPLPAGHEPQLTVALVGEGDRAFVTRRTGPAFPPLAAIKARLHAGLESR